MSDKFTRLARSLPSFYKAESNLYIRGLLKSWGLSDDNVTINIQETKDQIFVKTADGRHLDYLGNNVGVPRYPELSISDDDFRNLIPVMSFYPKQVRKTIVSLLDVFWGPGFTRANITSTNEQTYNLGPVSVIAGTVHFRKGSKVIEGTGTLFTSELAVGDYIKPTGADGTTYAKVSEILDDTHLELTEEWQNAYAIGTAVAKGVVRELIYKADKQEERTIRFIPNLFSDITAATAQEIVDGINQSVEHNQYIAANIFLDPVTDNRVNIRTVTTGLQGSIQITGGDLQPILGLDSNLHTELKANVYEINPNEIIVRIPSTVPILRRSLRGSAHPDNSKDVIFAVAEPYDFSSLGASSTLTIDVDGNPEVINFTHATDFVDPSSVMAYELAEVMNSKISSLEVINKTIDSLGKVGLRTTDGSAEYQVTGGTANSILGFDLALHQDLDLINAVRPSSYVFDPNGQLFTVTGSRSELGAIVPQGSIQTSLALADASNFPNSPGLLMVDFGRSGEEGPIKYNSRPNNSTLLIDATHTFQSEHLVGRSINYVDNNPTLPRVTGVDYPVYVVGTEGARIGAQDLIRRLIAAGVVIRFIIEFPEYLFECVCGCPEDLDNPNRKGSRTAQLPLAFK